MSSDTKREYLEILRLRYKKASRQQRPSIIDELCANTGMHRKSAIRLLRRGMSAYNSQRGRKAFYSEETIFHLRRVWIASDQMCGKALAKAMSEWLRFYPAASEAVNRQLLQMSAATIDRKLRNYKSKYRRGKRAGTKPGSILRSLIPIKSFTQVVGSAGFVEADTVAHCGGTLMGEFTWSLTFTDTFTGWTENRAVWGKSAATVHEAIADIEKNLPFEIRSFNCDNGSEFLNHRLIEYFNNRKDKDGKARLIMTRSRAYQKNDNCHVEQKNWTHVRRLFGYERFEFKDLIPLMNEVYRIHNLFNNFWIPTTKLKSKVRINGKVKKKYDEPKTPYQRLLDDPTLSEEAKNKLREIYATLNPFKLRELREQKLQAFHLMKQKLKFIKQQTDPTDLPKAPKKLPLGNFF